MSFYYRITNPEMFPTTYLGYVDPTDYYAYNGIPQPDGTVKPYSSLNELLLHIENRREAMRYTRLPLIREVVQQYLFSLGVAPKSYFTKEELPSGVYFQDKSIPNSPEKSSRSVGKDIQTAAALAVAFSKQAITGKKEAGAQGWATKQLAEERAKTCVNCIKNVDKKKSVITRFNNKIAKLGTKDRNTSLDKDLFDCDVCDCPLPVKVHYSDEVIKAVTPKSIKPSMFPQAFIGLKDNLPHKCWMIDILQNKKI